MQGRYCQCIENQLKGFRAKVSVDARPIGQQLESKYVPFEYPRTALSRDEIEAKLRRFGLQEYEVDLITDRFVDDKTLSDLNWNNESSARYHIKKTLAKLRKGDFKL